MISEKIDLRINGLKYSLQKIESLYLKTLDDVYLEFGFKYGVKYAFNQEYLEKWQLMRIHKKQKEQNLYYEIFSFSQLYYSTKEYLKKYFPEKSKLIENFYSNEKIHGFSRKDLSNDLKHNPNKDMKFRRVKYMEEKEVTGKLHKTTMYFKNTWEYQGMDSIILCESLYKELDSFLKKEFV